MKTCSIDRAHFSILNEVCHNQHRLASYILFAIKLATQSVNFAGITTSPNNRFMLQAARQLTDDFDGFLSNSEYLIMDRDS